MTEQATKRPWKVQLGGLSMSSPSDVRGASLRGPKNEAIATMCWWRDDDPLPELNANAALIVAAVNAYDGLRVKVGAQEQTIDDYSRKVKVIEAENQRLREAIHKADLYARNGDLESVKAYLDDVITDDNANAALKSS